jgi:osmoprotectant transport system substrate-binding protein
LTLGGPPECPNRPFCIPGLEKVYGIKFKEFKPLDIGGPITVQALEQNQVDVGLLFTTDAAIPQKGFVLLDDDKKLQLADNVAPVVRDDLLSKAPADFKTVVNDVSSKLTTAELTDLNKQTGVDRKEPKDVAAAWLKAKGITK